MSTYSHECSFFYLRSPMFVFVTFDLRCHCSTVTVGANNRLLETDFSPGTSLMNCGSSVLRPEWGLSLYFLQDDWFRSSEVTFSLDRLQKGGLFLRCHIECSVSVMSVHSSFLYPTKELFNIGIWTVVTQYPKFKYVFKLF